MFGTKWIPSMMIPMGTNIPNWFKPANLRAVQHAKRNLPHWTCPNGTYSVTFRTADSIPRKLQLKWKDHKSKFIKQHPKPWNDDIETAYRESITEKMETLLDKGYGGCYLKDPQWRPIVSGALKHFNHTRYHLETYVIMPNHVHVLFSPTPGSALHSILHSWKSYTGHELCKACGCKAPFWMEENWDTLVRSTGQFLRVREYIKSNPEKAHLQRGQYELYLRSRD